MFNQTSKFRPTPLGISDRPVHSAVSGIETIAIVLSVIWLIGAAIFFLTLPDQPSAPVDRGRLRFLMTMLAIFMPVAMIWVAATSARASRVMREESQRLQTAIDTIRQANIAQSQGRDLSSEPSVSHKLDEIAAAARKTETRLATFTTRRNAAGEPNRTAAPVVVETDDQPALALGTIADDITPPLATEEFIRALDFPETTEDEVGFCRIAPRP